MAYQSFKDLLVWQKASRLTVEVYKSFVNSRDYGFRDQIQRASVSVMNNIAEGYAKRSDKGLRNYLVIAKGSNAEVESMLLLATELDYLSSEKQEELLLMCNEVGKLLSGFIKKL